MNRFLTFVLSKPTSENDGQWDEVLPNVEYVFNYTKNRAIDTTPSLALFGTPQRRPELDKVTEFLQQNRLGQLCLQEIRDKAIIKNRQVQDYNKKFYDSKVKVDVVYEKGDYAMIRNYISPGEDKKFSPTFKGPYIITKVLPKKRYVIEDIEGFQISRTPFSGVFDAANMRLYVTQEPIDQNNLDEEIDHENDQDEESVPRYQF